MNSTARGWRPFVNISDKLDVTSTYVGYKPPPQQYQQRGLLIRHYRKKGRFIVQILTLSPVWSIHQLLLQQKENKSKFATSRETFPVDFLPRHDESSQFCFQPIYIPILNCLYPFWAWHEIFSVVSFSEMGWFPIRILDNFRFSPNSILDNFRFSPNSIFGQL